MLDLYRNTGRSNKTQNNATYFIAAVLQQCKTPIEHK